MALGAQILTLTNASTTFSGAIAGSGGVTLTGGTETLSGTNTYTGATTITGGTLALTGAGSLATSSGVADNGIFDISATTSGASIKTLSGSGSVALGAQTLTLTNASTAFSGAIAGSGGLTLTGGTEALSGTNTYTGATTITGGKLALTGAGSIASSSGVADNGIFDISGTTSGASIKTLSGSGSVALGAQTLTLTNASTAFSGAIGGSGGVTLTGGTETLSGTNTYTGATTINGGTLTITAGGSITSNVTNNATFNNSGTVTGNLTNTGTANNNLTITGAVNNAATFNNNAGATVSGLLTNTAGTTTNAGQLNGGANVTGGVVTNTDLISGSVAISGTGQVNNNLTITGTVNNAATFNNNAGATVSGLLTNTAGTTTNAGQLNGGANVTGGLLTNNDLISGSVAISGTGQVNNNLTITGAVNNAATFNNNAGATVSGLLTNTAGTTTNAGQLNGGANVTGGTLTTTGTIGGGLSNAATVNANGGAINGAIVNSANGMFNVGGTVTSNSTFFNASGGTLAVGSAGSYTLQGMLTNSGVVTVANGGQLIDTVGGITNNAGGAITVAVGGTVKDDLNNAGVVTNGGAYLANVATNTGAITNNGTWTGNVASNTGSITNNLTWTGTVLNAGTFNNSAGATVSGLLTNSGMTNNAGTLSGGLTNTAGITNNSGSIGGTTTITGGTLTGNGTIANLTVASGGTFAPGSGMPGSSMTATGNLAFQSGAFYLVQLNPVTASFANVAGTAALGGATVDAIYASGSYVSKTYTILTATGGVSGTFGPLVNTNLPAGFKTSLSYDAHDAFLNLTLNFVPPPNGGLNQNQQNVANAIVGFFNSTGSIPLVFGGLTPAGLTQASGETATGSQQTTFDAMNLFMGLLTDPFVNRTGNGANSLGATPFAEEIDAANAYAAKDPSRSKSERDAYAAIYRKAPPAAPFVPSWSVWAAGYGGSQTTDGNAAVGSNNTTSSIAGTAVGADYRFSPYTIAGFALAGGGTNFSVNGFGSGRSDLFQAGAYLRHTQGAAYISAALAYGWQDITTNRTVTIAGIDQLQARFNANAWSGRLEGGYRFVTTWMGVTPYAAAQFTTFDLPAYAEQAIVGANTFALAYGAKDVTDTRSELGIRTDRSWAMTDSIFTLRGRFAWAHDYDPNRSIGATFQTLPGASFVVNGAAQAHDSALTTASAEVKWANGWSAAATFEGEFSQVTNSYAGKGVVRYAW